MIAEKSLVIYKNRPAVVTEAADGKPGEKITISVLGEEGGRAEYRVREKDITLLHPGPAGLSECETVPEAPYSAVREAWELFSESGASCGAEPFGLRELAELVYGAFTPQSAWAAWLLLADGLFFTGDIQALLCRLPEDVEAEEKKREAKKKDGAERDSFLDRLKEAHLRAARKDGPSKEKLKDEDGRFLQDVEALAYGKTEKSRTMKDLALSETPEDAHRLLLETDWWTPLVNPHPVRFNVAVSSAKTIPDPPPPEDRRDLRGLAAFAVDSPWSADPDDAVSIDGDSLYVHVADPASSILPGSPAEKEARGRGATLYLPEGVSRMLADETLRLFALGLSETSPALTFKITLDKKGEITGTEIFPSLVKVTRLSYAEADSLCESGHAEMTALRTIARRNLERRLEAGAVNIEMPETHISVNDGKIFIEPIVNYESAGTVRECMLLAGEAAARWALEHSLPFPFVCQEAGDLPADPLPGMAGSWQIRRCMRPRSLSVKPGVHWGLGLDAYTQVTSPLRRYTDLFAHFQIRALLRGEKPLGADETVLRIGAGEAAAQAVTQAERASRLHWTAAYLSGRVDSVWDAVALEKKGQRWAFVIPALALETQAAVRGETGPNEEVKLILKSVNIPRGEAVFVSGSSQTGSR